MGPDKNLIYTDKVPKPLTKNPLLGFKIRVIRENPCSIGFEGTLILRQKS